MMLLLDSLQHESPFRTYERVSRSTLKPSVQASWEVRVEHEWLLGCGQGRFVTFRAWTGFVGCSTEHARVFFSCVPFMSSVQSLSHDESLPRLMGAMNP